MAGSTLKVQFEVTNTLSYAASVSLVHSLVWLSQRVPHSLLLLDFDMGACVEHPNASPALISLHKFIQACYGSPSCSTTSSVAIAKQAAISAHQANESRGVEAHCTSTVLVRHKRKHVRQALHQ
jgi:hypothetical protein